MERGDQLESRITLQEGQVWSADLVVPSNAERIVEEGLEARVIGCPKVVEYFREGPKVVDGVEILLGGSHRYALPRQPLEETGQVGMLRLRDLRYILVSGG